MLIIYLIGLVVMGALLGYANDPQGPDEVVLVILGTVAWPATLSIIAGLTIRDYLASRRA